MTVAQTQTDPVEEEAAATPKPGKPGQKAVSEKSLANDFKLKIKEIEQKNKEEKA